MKSTIITILLAVVAMTGQAKVYKTIKNPEAMACVNMFYGKLEARKVIFSDTATTVHFTIRYKQGQTFSFAKESHLIDENGNRYPLRSTEGIKAGSWLQVPESGTLDFTMHFEPMPKKVQLFDFTEGDFRTAFMLLGIHDKKTKLKAPTLQELSKANPWTIPADWLKTDTITIRGRFENYDAEKFGFTSMECYYEDAFEKDDATLVLDIAPDGTFQKKFQASYPIHHHFRTNGSKVGFEEMPFFARPGETIDITVRKNEHGQLECYYNNGSSKEVERWLKTDSRLGSLSQNLSMFKGKISEMGKVADRTWQNMLYQLNKESQSHHYTSMEMQLALAELQVSYAEALMDYAMYHEDDLMKQEQRDGIYYTEILDSVEFKEVRKLEYYTPLHRTNLNNPLTLISSSYPITINRIQYARPIWNAKYEDGGYVINEENTRKVNERMSQTWCDLMGCKQLNLMGQLCFFKEYLNGFNSWRHDEAYLKSMVSVYLERFTNPYIRQKAEAYYAQKMAQKELSTPLPADNKAADLIRDISKKYPGRYLMIDFWGMGCGPCRSAIQSSKNLRQEIAKRDDIKLIFIAGERVPGGSDAYKNYVSEWLADEEAICIPDADFTRLQELFRFNGIPHYEVITPDCRRVRDDLQIHGFYNFDNEMKLLKERLK